VKLVRPSIHEENYAHQKGRLDDSFVLAQFISARGPASAPLSPGARTLASICPQAAKAARGYSARLCEYLIYSWSKVADDESGLLNSIEITFSSIDAQAESVILQDQQRSSTIVLLDPCGADDIMLYQILNITDMDPERYRHREVILTRAFHCSDGHWSQSQDRHLESAAWILLSAFSYVSCSAPPIPFLCTTTLFGENALPTV